MDKRFSNIAANIRLQILVVSVLLFFLLKFLFFTEDSLILLIINELLVLTIAYMIVVNLTSVIDKSRKDPMKQVYTLSVLNAFILLYFYLSSFLFDVLADVDMDLVRLLKFFYTFVALVLAAYELIILRDLFFIKQKKNLRVYYNAMLVFILLASLTAFLQQSRFDELEFINIAFMVNAIILIFINSLRFSWIAFLTKKQKRILLLISIAQAAVYSFNISFITRDPVALANEFSYSANQLLFLINLYGIIYFGVLFFSTLFHLPTAEAIDRKSREISSLQYFSKLINRVIDSKELEDTVTELAVEIGGADAAWIVITEKDDYQVRSPRNAGFLEAKKIFDYLSTQSAFKVNDYLSIADLSGYYKRERAFQKYFTLASVPLESYKKINGYLLFARENDVPFDDDDRKSIETFAEYAAIAIENSMLLQESIEKQRMERELQVAREMQRKLIPQTLPQSEYLDISAAFIPAFEVGGDYYDFFDLPDGNLGFVIADVSGKGISAAFPMAELRGIFQSVTRLKNNPKEILEHANGNLKRSLDTKSFITATFGVIDFQNAKVKFARAGHMPLLHMRGDEIKEFTPVGLGLGLDYSASFGELIREETSTLEEDDLIVLYTDGITEAQNEQNEEWGLDALKRIIIEKKNSDTNEITAGIINAVEEFSGKSSQHDDITLVILRWKFNNNGENNG